MLALLQTLTDDKGHRVELAGLLLGHGIMQTRLSAIGSQSVALPEGELRGHTFHYSRMEAAPKPITHGTAQHGGTPGEAVYREGRLHASYLHLYFPSNPQAVTRLFAP